MHLITQTVHVLFCSNSAMKGSNWINAILYHDTLAQNITESIMCLTVNQNQACRIVDFLVCSTSVNTC
jgi:hypothetical protein